MLSYPQHLLGDEFRTGDFRHVELSLKVHDALIIAVGNITAPRLCIVDELELTQI